MNPKWMLKFLGLSAPVCFDTPGAEGAGSGQQQGAGDGGDADAGDGGDDAGGDEGGDEFSARGSSQGDDTESDEDLLFEEEPTDLPADEILKRVRASKRKLARRLARAKPYADRFRREDGSLEDLDEVLENARRYRELTSRAERGDPRARAILNGRGEGAGEGRSDERAPVFAMTEENLGFNPRESRANTMLAQALRDVHDLKWKLRSYDQLAQQVGSVAETTRQSSEQQSRREWTDETKRVLDHVRRALPNQKFVHQAVQDAIAGARATASQHGRSPADIANHYLDLMRRNGLISNKQAGQAATRGQQQRMAERNRQLPNQRQGGGAPAPAGSGKKVTLRDVHARVRSGAAFNR